MSSVTKTFDSTVKESLTFDLRPATPPEIRKYRRSANLEAGKRFIHHGIADDVRTMGLDEKIYGAVQKNTGGTAQELINHDKLSDLEKLNIYKAEKTYKGAAREPLGKCYSHNYRLPSKFTEGNEAFGVKSKSSVEPAKDVLFPTMSEDAIEKERIYIRTHGSYAPGEQKTRGYKWDFDPHEKKFGRRGESIAFNGVSKNITDVLQSVDDRPDAVVTKNVEDYRGMKDFLGRSRNLGQGSGDRPFDYTYGKPSATARKAASGKPHFGALDVIRGNYSVEDQLPDRDLGKSITPGFRNVSLEARAYGCPSIRNDLPQGAGARRSLADSQNYGDDVAACDLISPPAYSDLSFDAGTLSNPRPREKLLTLFQKIGYELEADVFEAIFLEASCGDFASISNFRRVLNDYLEACDTGYEKEWRRDRRL